MENRDINRLRKRITVRYGQDAADRVAFTEDISQSGIFIKTAQVLPPGKPIKLEFELYGATVKVEGTVAWARRVPPNLIRLAKKGGMGVRITSFEAGEEAYLRLLAETGR
jgi:Tfp pilus assembly protein PilZ